MRAICNIKVNMRLRNFPFVEQKAVGNAGADKNNIARGAVILCAVINERNLTALEVYQLIIVDDASRNIIPRRKSGLRLRANVKQSYIKKRHTNLLILPVKSASAAARELWQGWKVNSYIIWERGKPTLLADVKGEGAVNHIRITNSAVTVRQLLMRIYFDGQTSPAVDVPLSDFFANADCSEYRRISSMVICCNPRKGFNSYFEMPYFKGFRIELENIGTSDASIYYRIDCEEKEISPDSLDDVYPPMPTANELEII